MANTTYEGVRQAKSQSALSHKCFKPRWNTQLKAIHWKAGAGKQQDTLRLSSQGRRHLSSPLFVNESAATQHGHTFRLISFLSFFPFVSFTFTFPFFHLFSFFVYFLILYLSRARVPSPRVYPSHHIVGMNAIMPTTAIAFSATALSVQKRQDRTQRWETHMRSKSELLPLVVKN